MAYSRTYFTVKTNGQTLAVSATAPGGGSSALHLTSAVSSAVTQPYTITSDTTFYVLDELAGDYVLSAKQPDGSELFGKAVKLQPGDPKTVEPVPSALQVAADTGEPFGGYRKIVSGEYYGAVSGAPGTNAMGTGGLTLVPFWCPASMTADRIAAEVTSGAASAVVRLGIFANDPATDCPAALLVDGGTIDGNSATAQTVTISQSLSRGLYWLGAVSQVASATLRTIGSADAPPVSANSFVGGSASGGMNCYYKASVTGAFAAGGYTGLTATTLGYKVKVRAA